MQQININVPDNYPQDRLKKKISELEKSFKKEMEVSQEEQNKTDNSVPDSWDTLDIESIAVNTGRTDGSINHDYYIYGKPQI